MADCRMGPRSSAEMLDGGGGGGGGSGSIVPVPIPIQIVSGSGGGGSGSGRGQGGNQGGCPVNGSRSYHHQLPQQFQFYNVNGFSPVVVYPTSPLSNQGHQQQQQHHLQHQQQYVGGGGGGMENNGGGFGNGQQQQSAQVGQDPPARPWIQLSHPKHKRACFTVLCYNILCSRYATPTLYSYCPGWALDWNYRRKAILQELVHYAPDIISLQEMETDQFYNFFLPQLQVLGYSGIFGAKSRARTMVESKRKLVDGCAIFYRTNKFRLLSEHLIEFSQVAMANAQGRGEEQNFSEEMINRVQTKDNIALVALLESKLDSEHSKGLHGLVTPRSQPILVCTCHIHWDPNYCDVKLVQTMMLMQELRKITDDLDLDDLSSSSPPSAASGKKKNKGQSSSSKSKSTLSSPESSSPSSSPPSSPSNNSSILDKVNLLICGDFNSLPGSGVFKFMETGNISCTHPDFKGLSYEDYLDSSTKLSPARSDSSPQIHPPPPEEFKHGFNLHSAYPPDTMPFTNYTLDFQGVIDYVFHSAKGLRPLGILGPLDSSWLVQNNIVGAPHPGIPSDHLPLLVELELIPAI